MPARQRVQVSTSGAPPVSRIPKSRSCWATPGATPRDLLSRTCGRLDVAGDRSFSFCLDQVPRPDFISETGVIDSSSHGPESATKELYGPELRISEAEERFDRFGHERMVLGLG